MTDALLQADRAAGNRLAQLRSASSEGILEGVSLQTRAFNPGHRTADRGLGDNSGTISIRADDNKPHRWTLYDTRGLDGSGEGLVAEADGVEVTVVAGEGGTYLLRAHSGSQKAGEILLSVPYLVPISHSVDGMKAAFDHVNIPVPDQAGLWSAITQTATNVASHVLRPVNVRLDWNGRSPRDVIEQSQASAGPTLVARRFGGEGAIRATGVLVGPSVTLLEQDGRTFLLHLEQIFQTFLAPDQEHDRAWHTIVSDRVRDSEGNRFAARVAARLGGEGDDIDQILRALADGVVNDAGERHWTEIAGRLLGVTVARAVLRVIGMSPADTTARSDDALPCEVMAKTPLHVCHSILGLHRPDGATIDDLPDALASVAGDASADDRRAAMETTWGDLVDLFTTEWNTPSAATTGYDVLAGLVTTEFLHAAQLRAPLPAPYGRRTHVPGSRDADSSPARYGTEQDDLDGRGTAVADLQSDLKRVGIDYGLEPEGSYGYRRIAFQGAALDPDIFDGESGNTYPAHGPAKSRLVQKGYTGLAVREFQIAARYPNDVVEQLTVATPYADRLAVAVTDTERAGDGTAGTPLDQPDGELEPIDGIRLQQWVFARRRLPVVIESRVQVNSGSDWSIANTKLYNNAHADNLIGPNDVNSTAPRMFVLDLSGMPQRLDSEVAQERRSLGDNGKTDGYGGPHASRHHAIKTIGLNETFGEDSTVHAEPPAGEDDPGSALLPELSDNTPAEVRGWFNAVWDVLYAVTKKETGGKWDGYNGWDSAVWSYPLFHFTARLSDATQGKMGGLVYWLQKPNLNIPQDGDVRDRVYEVMKTAYQRAFGRYGIGTGPIFTDMSAYMHIAGLREVSGGTGSGAWNLDMATDSWHDENGANKARMQVRYASYVQWFRSWQWAARFARNLRFDQTLQRVLVAHGIDWIASAMERNVPGGNAHELVTSKRAAAAYIRAYVRFPRESENGFRAVPSGTWTSDQEAAITAFIAGIGDARLRATATEAVAEIGTDTGTMPSPSQLRMARDWVLRSLL